MQTYVRDWLRAFTIQVAHARDDLHVDQINAAFKDPSTWADAGARCFQIAADTARSENLPITIAMEFFLKASRKPTGLRERHLRDLRMSWTPPALTVFRPGTEPWANRRSFVPVQIETGIPVSIVTTVYFQEWFDKLEGTYDRRLWFVAVNRVGSADRK